MSATIAPDVVLVVRTGQYPTVRRQRGRVATTSRVYVDVLDGITKAPVPEFFGAYAAASAPAVDGQDNPSQPLETFATETGFAFDVTPTVFGSWTLTAGITEPSIETVSIIVDVADVAGVPGGMTLVSYEAVQNIAAAAAASAGTAAARVIATVVGAEAGAAAGASGAAPFVAVAQTAAANAGGSAAAAALSAQQAAADGAAAGAAAAEPFATAAALSEEIALGAADVSIAERIAAEAARVLADQRAADALAEAIRAQAAADTTAATVANAAVQAASVTALVAAWTAAGATEGAQGVVYTVGPEEGVYRRLSGVPVRVGDTQRQIEGRVTTREAQIDQGRLTARRLRQAGSTVMGGAGDKIIALARGRHRAFRMGTDAGDLLAVDSQKGEAWALRMLAERLRFGRLDTAAEYIKATRLHFAFPDSGARIPLRITVGNLTALLLDRVTKRIAFPDGYGITASGQAELGQVAATGVTSSGPVTAPSVTSAAIAATTLTAVQATNQQTTTTKLRAGPVAGRAFHRSLKTVMALVRGDASAFTFSGTETILRFNTQTDTLHPRTPDAAPALPQGAMVSRGGSVELSRWQRPITDGYVKTGPIFSQDAGYATRTHNMFPAVAVVGSRIWMAWMGTKSTTYNPADDSTWFGELVGTFLVFAYSDNLADGFTEAFYLLPPNAATDRLFEPLLQATPDGRLRVMFPMSGNAQSHDHQLGCWQFFLNNPLAKKGWWLSEHRWMADGIPGCITEVDGETFASIDYWQSFAANPHGNGFNPRRPDRVGKRVYRLGRSLSGEEFAEHLSTMPLDDPAITSYNESKLVQLPDGTLLGQWRTFSGIYESRKPVGGDWSAPALFTGFAQTANSRHALRRSPSGRIWLMAHDSATRVNATIAEYLGPSVVQHKTLIDARGVTYFEMTFKGPQMLAVADYGRGQNASGLKDILLYDINEQSVVDGAPVITTYRVAQ